MTSISLHPPIGKPAGSGPRAARPRSVASPWAWMAVTCLLLGTGGGLRLWRQWTFSSLARESAESPIALVELPRTMGTWRAADDVRIQTDPEVMRYAGASEHVERVYFDSSTGEPASTMALYGLGLQVYAHVPEICYPAAGYQPVIGPIDRTIAVPGIKGPVRYRWAVYARKEGGGVRYEEVYHSFLHHGDWIADANQRWKQYRHYPGLFKVQIAHPLASTLKDAPEGPCVGLLTEFIRQIDGRVNAARPADGAATTAAADPPK